MNNGTFTLLVDTKKMETLAKEFYAYVQLEDDKGNKSPISMRLMVRVVIKDKLEPKIKVIEEEKIVDVDPPVNVKKLFTDSMNANPEIPLM